MFCVVVLRILPLGTGTGLVLVNRKCSPDCLLTKGEIRPQKPGKCAPATRNSAKFRLRRWAFVALNHPSLVLQPLARPQLRFRTAAPWLRLARLGAALLRAGRAARTSTSASHCTHRATTAVRIVLFSLTQAKASRGCTPNPLKQPRWLTIALDKGTKTQRQEKRIATDLAHE